MDGAAVNWRWLLISNLNDPIFSNLNDPISMEDAMGWRERLSYWERRRLTCRGCDEVFRSEKKKQKHADTVHGYYTHGNGEQKDDLRCPHCQVYVPGKNVVNPKDCLRNHMRSRHKDYAKPYLIEEQP